MKKWLALILIVFLMVVGTACSQKEEPTPEPETPTVGENEAEVVDGDLVDETKEPNVDDGETKRARTTNEERKSY
ncbi:hypothetical protein KHA80_05875 [Anaerobacillus sp. HL2]|nr:hypothetical protein KHA80_05875 [Anaerobacillus sp. HL2]